MTINMHTAGVVSFGLGRLRDLTARLPAHAEWLKRGRAIEIHAAIVDSPDDLSDVESLLIYVHQPIYNKNQKDSIVLSRPRVIHNTGQFRNLLPVIDSRYPWYNRVIAIRMAGELCNEGRIATQGA